MTIGMENCVLIPITDLCTPKDGYSVYLNRYWTVKNGCALFYQSGSHLSPQCNSNETIARKLTESLWPDCESKFIAVAYVKPDKD